MLNWLQPKCSLQSTMGPPPGEKLINTYGKDYMGDLLADIMKAIRIHESKPNIQWYHLMVKEEHKDAVTTYLTKCSTLLEYYCRCNNNEDVHWHYIIMAEKDIRPRLKTFCHRHLQSNDHKRRYYLKNIKTISHLACVFIYIQTDHTKGWGNGKLKECSHHQQNKQPTFPNKQIATKWKKEVLYNNCMTIRVDAERQWRSYLAHKKTHRNLFTEDDEEDIMLVTENVE